MPCTEDKNKAGLISTSEEIVAKKIGNLLGQIRFLSKENFDIKNEHFENLFKTNDELFLEIGKAGSKNLIEIRNRGPRKEIYILLQDILSKKTIKELNSLTKLYMRRNLLDDEAKKVELKNIKKILVNIEFISQKTTDLQIKERINYFKEHFKNL